LEKRGGKTKIQRQFAFFLPNTKKNNTCAAFSWDSLGIF